MNTENKQTEQKFKEWFFDAISILRPAKKNSEEYLQRKLEFSDKQTLIDDILLALSAHSCCKNYTEFCDRVEAMGFKS